MMRLPVFYALKRIANYDFLLFLIKGEDTVNPHNEEIG